MSREVSRLRVLPESPDQAFLQAAVASALFGYLSRSAESGPILCVIEDVHWATATTLDVLRHVGRSSARAPVLFLVTTRGALRPHRRVERLPG